MSYKWQYSPLDDVCSVEYGTRVVKKRDQGTRYPVYGGGGATFFVDAHNRTDRLVISRFGMSEKCTRYVSGKFFLNDSGLTVSPRDPEQIDQRFLEYHLVALSDDIYFLGRGTAQKNLDVDAFRQLVIGWPPLPVQRRIVAVLDEAFEGIDRAIANTEKNLANARELFESHLNRVFSEKGDGWVESPIRESFRVKSGAFLPAKAMADCGTFPVYGGNGVAGSHSEANASGENIIIGRVGAKCGNVHRVSGDVWITDNALYISDYHRSFDSDFLARLLSFKDLRSRANQTAQPVISYTTIKDVVLDFPASIKHQNEIALDIENMEEVSQRLKVTNTRKLAALVELKQSILQKAFSGELTAEEDQTSQVSETCEV